MDEIIRKLQRHVRLIFERRPMAGRQCIDDISSYQMAYMIAHGWMRLDITRAVLPNVPFSKIVRRENETSEHLYLKLAGRDWLEDMGSSEIQEEEQQCGGIADLYAPDIQWRVECGNTKLSRINDLVGSGVCAALLQIPYQPRTAAAVDAIKEGRAPPMTAFSFAFQWGQAATEYICETNANVASFTKDRRLASRMRA